MPLNHTLLEYMRIAQGPAPEGAALRVAVVTNFTDDLLVKLLRGMCLADGIPVELYQVPFKQYARELKDPDSSLLRHKADITCVCFDVGSHGPSEFFAPGHVTEVIADLARYAAAGNLLAVASLAMPAAGQYARLLKDTPLHHAVSEFNSALKELARTRGNVVIVDTDALVRRLGERHVRDARGHYAFSQPFSNDFLLALASEFRAHIRAYRGVVRKCIVVDLDNTLWGGVVGEVGPMGIVLGPEFPGNAYQQLQRLLLQYFEHGVILAINSRNNPEDVDEVFEKNPYMILKKEHFASIVANWGSKADNLRLIAEDLNIGLDSLIFIDDDPVNRDLVRTQLPQVLVPELGDAPEEYPGILLNLDAFHASTLTEEDKARGAMYAAERERKGVSAALSLEEYMATLQVVVVVTLNDTTLISRISQLTRKTNQYNLTTRRYSESDIGGFMQDGSLVFAGDVRDKFGPYGITIVAIIRKIDGTWELDTWLMSCRVMARGVEALFWEKIKEHLQSLEITSLHASYIPTQKNAPAKEFLPSIGGRVSGEGVSGEVLYTLPV